jgi:hypothetical protein
MNVHVIEFNKMAGPYRTGEQAAFAPELADEYIKRGFAKMVQRDVPAIEPAVVASDAQRRLTEIKASIDRAERDAKSVEKSGGAVAAESLAMVAAARAQLTAVQTQLNEAGPLSNEEPRAPSARARAA